MRVNYDKGRDMLYLAFREGPSDEIVESVPNIILELDEDKEIHGAGDLEPQEDQPS